MYKCCFGVFCARQRARWLRAELTFNNDLRIPKKNYAFLMDRRWGQLFAPGTRRTESHVDDDSVVNNHSEGDASARASTRGKAGRVTATVRCVVGGGVITKLSELFAAININWHFSSINAFIPHQWM